MDSRDEIIVTSLFDSPSQLPTQNLTVNSVKGTIITTVPSEEDVTGLGNNLKDAYSTITNKLLSSAKTSDLGEMGGKLTELITVAKGFDPKQVKHGFFDSIASKFHNERENLLGHFQSIEKRVDELTSQMDKMVALQHQRIGDLTALQHENLEYFLNLQTAVAQGKQWIEAITAQLATPPDANNALAAAEYASIQHRSQRLAVAVNDFENSMTLAKQKAVELQMTTDNAQALLDEFSRAKSLVIPALKSTLTQQLIAIEQKGMVNLDSTIRDTLDAALHASAQQTADNTVQIAAMQQKATVSTLTLTECQGILEAAEDKVRQLEEAGRQSRIADAAARSNIEARLLAQVTRS
jgi:uncharacterized protein YaaN involved in tellurite resistance